jgi:hypothetical protein
MTAKFLAPMLASALLGVAPLAANDVIFLEGRIQLPDGGAVNRAADIRLTCKGAEPSRQTTTGKNGKFFLKVERDEFNHIARLMSTTTAREFNDGSIATNSCSIEAVLPGYESSTVDLSGFVITKDLRLPEIVLKPKAK